MDRETFLFTDAGKKSNDPNNKHGGFSAILCQKDESGNFLPIEFASRSIAPVETGYSQIELEARALRYGIEKFRYFLQGIDKVTSFVDAKALLPFFNHENREAPPRIQRQILAVQDIPMVLVHIEGKNNPANFLSRERNVDNDASASDLQDMEVSDSLDSYLIKVIREREDQAPMALSLIKELTLKDPVLKFLKLRILGHDFDKHKKDERIKPYYGVRHELSIIDDLVIRGARRIVLPEDLHAKAVALIHSLAHQGQTATEQLLTSRFWFPSYSTLVRSEVDMCELCKHAVIPKRQEPAGLTPTAGAPFEVLSIDFKGPLETGDYAFVILCTFSKWPEVYSVTSTSFQAIKKHLESFFAANGRPSVIRSDNGPPFQSHEFAEYLKGLNIKHSRILPEHPQSNEVENFMRNLRKAIKIAKLQHKDHKTFVRRMLMAFRATPSRTTGVSPFYAATGRYLDPILDTKFPPDK